MNILRFLAVFVMLFLALSPAISKAEDTQGPIITNIEVVSNGESSYDTIKPGFNYWRVNSLDYPIGIVGDEIAITTSVYDTLSNVKKVYIVLESPNEEKTINLSQENSGMWTWSTTLQNEDVGIWTLKKIAAEDDYGNINEITPNNSKIYVLPSDYTNYNSGSLISITDTHDKIKISFSEEMDTSTLTKENIMLIENEINQFSNIILDDYTMSVSSNNDAVIIDRPTGYERNKSYIVVAHKNIKDIDGNQLENPMFIKFKYIPTITYKLFINGQQVIVDSPIQKRGVEFLTSLRSLSEMLDINTQWDNAKQQIIYSNDNTTLTMTLNEKSAILNGENVVMDVAPVISDGRTMAPLKFVVSAFGGSVEVINDEIHVNNSENMSGE